MIDITHKFSTLRQATAEATVQFGTADTMALIKENKVPKGNVLEAARTAGLFAVKQTANSIPDCHPLPIEFTKVDYELGEDSLRIMVTCKTIYKTGVEVEAMHGASIVALTVYDMLKPVDKQIEIQNIRLLKKTGGKSDMHRKSVDLTQQKVGVITCSNPISRGDKEDTAAKWSIDYLRESGLTDVDHVIVEENSAALGARINEYTQDKKALILVFGSTGLAKKDVARKTIEPLLEVTAPAIVQAAVAYGLERSSLAMLSAGSAGVIDESLVISLPGSTAGAQDSMKRLFPFLLRFLGRWSD